MSDDTQPSFLGGLPSRGAPSWAAPSLGAAADPSHVQGTASAPEPESDRGGQRNTLALVAFIGSFFVSLVGIVCGHIALKQIKRTGQDGRGFALAGVIIGYVGFVSGAIAIVMIVATISAATAVYSSTVDGLQPVVGDGSSTSSTDTPASAADTAEAANVAAGGGSVEGHTVSPELCAALKSFVSVGGEAASSKSVSPELLAATEALAAIASPNQTAYMGYANLLANPASIGSETAVQALSADFVKAAEGDLATCA
ncbi:DUF4190 domain-containing protein [Cryobacterium zhongshanensis]|uniref:DUF4190 domain-containing protein n=1 Tax=Cryobacterium zhongshanensis TaxID=2928153 RepID=A0AA41R1X4_9MICO|nr:DUF4190 domain-containing protein [Cryobacterium zhongshanensis]MCI4659551.1 DUF4190 domain-containing protein [Cryobacterium zhongshanensis]